MLKPKCLTEMHTSCWSVQKVINTSLTWPTQRYFLITFIHSLSLCSFYQPFSRWTWVSWCLLKQKMMEVVVTTGAISRAKLESNHHHQQTNTQLFTGWMPFLSPNQQCQSTEGKISHSMDLLTPSSPGCLPSLSFTTNSSWLPWGRVSMPLISSLMPVPQMPVKLCDVVCVFLCPSRITQEIIHKGVYCTICPSDLIMQL